MSETTANDRPTAGFRVVWTSEGDFRPWRLAEPKEAAERKCRRPGCQGVPVAALNRGFERDGRRRDSWWLYCGEHLYGRRIRDGKVEHRRLVLEDTPT